MERICLICNPTAKSGAAKASAEQVKALLRQSGAAFTVCETEHVGHATELSRRAAEEGVDCVVAVGGDGTLRECALPLLHTNVTLGIVPCGTGNDLARSLGISTDLPTAVDTILHGSDKWIDAGSANGQTFFNVAGFGFDVDVLDYTDAFKSRCKNGSTAYLMGLLKGLFGLKLRRARITFANETIEKNILLIAAANGRFFGGGMEVAPQADVSDGLLDVCVIHDVNFFSALSVLPRFMKGKHLETKYVTYRKEKTVHIECEPVSRIEVDGERMPGTPVSFCIEEHALKLRVPGR